MSKKIGITRLDVFEAKISGHRLTLSCQTIGADSRGLYPRKTEGDYEIGITHRGKTAIVHKGSSFTTALREYREKVRSFLGSHLEENEIDNLINPALHLQYEGFV